jgi:hypothetical protein
MYGAVVVERGRKGQYVDEQRRRDDGADKHGPVEIPLRA